MRKAAVLYTANVLLFMGSLWQLEIADNFLLNDWGPFRFLFNLIVVEDVWIVRDFWMGLMLASFLLNSAVALYLYMTSKNVCVCV